MRITVRAIGLLLMSFWVFDVDAAESDASSYKISPSDLLVVGILGEKDFPMIEFRVSPSGTIRFPYLEDVEVKGRTTGEAEKHLKELLMKDHFRNPEVIVRVKEYKKRSVTVLGEVNRQGEYVFLTEQGMNLLEAIGQASGFTQAADTKNITISRAGEKIKFNYKDYLKKPGEGKVPQVEPGDVIMVPETVF